MAGAAEEARGRAVEGRDPAEIQGREEIVDLRRGVVMAVDGDSARRPG